MPRFTWWLFGLVALIVVAFGVARVSGTSEQTVTPDVATATSVTVIRATETPSGVDEAAITERTTRPASESPSTASIDSQAVSIGDGRTVFVRRAIAPRVRTTRWLEQVEATIWLREADGSERPLTRQLSRTPGLDGMVVGIGAHDSSPAYDPGSNDLFFVRTPHGESNSQLMRLDLGGDRPAEFIRTLDEAPARITTDGRGHVIFHDHVVTVDGEEVRQLAITIATLDGDTPEVIDITARPTA